MCKNLNVICLLSLSLIGFIVSAQSSTIISGIDSTLTTHAGYNIYPRNYPIDLRIENCKFTKRSSFSGYILQVGDDSYKEANSQNLNGTVIIGNYLDYSESTKGSVHSIIAGYNLDYKIRYNYFDNAYYGIVAEGGYNNGDSMVNTSYHVNGNIFRNNDTPFFVMGYDNLKFYNNTVYHGKGTTNKIIKVDVSNGTQIPAFSKNIKIRNNIFYSVSNPNIITVTAGCAEGFECDYNIYWCEESPGNEMVFMLAGVEYSWTDWQRLGYDKHSVVMNPNFIDTISFVPASPLKIGVNLGEEFMFGLSADADWVVGIYPDTIEQNDIWQIGAVINNVVNQVPEEFNSSFIKLYPNPNYGHFSVSLMNSLSKGENTVTIFKAVGKPVYCGLFDQGVNIMNYNLSHLESGIYFLAITSENTIISIEKFVKN